MSVREINVLTGEETVREYTPEEVAANEAAANEAAAAELAAQIPPEPTDPITTLANQLKADPSGAAAIKNALGL